MHVTPKTILDIGQFLQRGVKSKITFEDEGLRIIQELIQPWEEKFSLISSLRSIQECIIQEFPNQLAEIILQGIQMYNSQPHLLSEVRPRVSQLMVGAILEQTIELAQNNYVYSVDSYYIYASIHNHPDLYQLFGHRIPKFAYPDEFSIPNFLETHYPQKKFTEGFCEGLQSHIELIIGVIVSYDSDRVDTVSAKYGPIQKSSSRREAILQLRENMVRYVVDQSSNSVLSFTDILHVLKVS